MLLPADQRRALGAFLRARREVLTPAAAGLAVAGRRRTPGLRREEVAQLSGLSTTWLTWAEQGRDIALSEAALSRLAGALRLSSAERSYLFELTRRRDPAPPRSDTSAHATDFDAAVAAMSVPAYVLGPLWDALAWNTDAFHLFRPWLGSGEANLLRFVFLDLNARQFVHDWPDRARRLIAEFRADTAHRPDDPLCHALVQDLAAKSTVFARLWAEQGVLFREGGERRFNHPDQGPLVFSQVTLLPAADPEYKIVMLIPERTNVDVPSAIGPTFKPRQD